MVAAPEMVGDRRVFKIDPPVVGGRLYSRAEPVPRLTPTDAVFRRRSQPTVATLAPQDWQLHFEGLVERSEPLGMDELRNGFRPMLGGEVFHMCAGDGRFDMKAEGTQWRRGDSMAAIEVAGVPLGAILDEAKVKPGAQYVTLVSGDGMENYFDLRAAKNPRVLVVPEINGEELIPELGGPVRIAARGSYGVRWTGNIARVVVSSEKPLTRVNDKEYRYRYGDGEQGLPVDEIRVISHVMNVQSGDIISPDAEIVVWAGVGSTNRLQKTVNEVVFSTNGGETWEALDKLEVPRVSAVSRGIIAASRLPRGPVSLVTKANDSWGMEQPPEARWNSGGYGNNGWNHPVEFEVAA